MQGSCSPQPKNGIARGLGQAVRSGALPMKDALDFLCNFMGHNAAATVNWADGLSGLASKFSGGNVTLYQMYELLHDVAKPLGPWRYAIQGMLDQIWSGECTMGEVIDFLMSAARSETASGPEGGLLVRAVGTRNGHPAVEIRRRAKPGKDSVLFKTMGTVTGISTAAFMVLAMEEGKERTGVLCPEDWAEPQAFYKALQLVGVPEDDIVESI